MPGYEDFVPLSIGVSETLGSKPKGGLASSLWAPAVQPSVLWESRRVSSSSQRGGMPKDIGDTRQAQICCGVCGAQAVLCLGRQGLQSQLSQRQKGLKSGVHSKAVNTLVLNHKGADKGLEVSQGMHAHATAPSLPLSWPSLAQLRAIHGLFPFTGLLALACVCQPGKGGQGPRAHGRSERRRNYRLQVAQAKRARVSAGTGMANCSHVSALECGPGACVQTREGIGRCV